MENEHIIHEDLTTCDREPIHIIGSIQPHGYLLGISADDYRITYASENCIALFGFKDLIGRTVHDLDAFDNKKKLADYLNVNIDSVGKPIHNPHKFAVQGINYNLITHRAGSVIVMEFEPERTLEPTIGTNTLLGDIMLKLNVTSSDITALLQVVADQLRLLIGYDRIMIYKFWEDWHGEVVAESKIDSLDPFLGLHYPASDIPRQARELYKKNLTRILVDRQAAPSKLLSENEIPLDLSHSQLRSVSPMHIEYLENMGVGATFSISLIHQGELWGLIACHHSEAKFIDFEQRKASEIVSQYLTRVLELKTHENNNARLSKFNKSVDIIESQMRSDWDVVKGLTAHDTTLTDINDSSGAALIFDGNMHLVGKTPSREQINSILDWLYSYKQRDKIFHTTNLSKFIPEASNWSEVGSGLLAVTLSAEMKESLLWFKPEHNMMVNWAGKTDKDLSRDEDGNIRLSPRKSFEKWTHQMQETSITWSSAEIASAINLSDKVRSVIELKSNEIRRLNKKLSEAYEELDSFSYTISHDLKTPLNTLRGYLEIFLEEKEDLTDDPILDKVLKNTDLMGEMITNIFNYSKMSRSEFVAEPVALKPIIEEVKQQVSQNRDLHSLDYDLDNELMVQGNKTLLFQVFLNLIDNAIKYRDPSRPCTVRVSSKEMGPHVILSVTDNGIGISSNHFDKIFNLFGRVSPSSRIEGSGVGLSIVKRIIEKHDGKIWVESTLGQGTTFHVQLNKYDKRS